MTINFLANIALSQRRRRCCCWLSSENGRIPFAALLACLLNREQLSGLSEWIKFNYTQFWGSDPDSVLKRKTKTLFPLLRDGWMYVQYVVLCSFIQLLNWSSKRDKKWGKICAFFPPIHPLLGSLRPRARRRFACLGILACFLPLMPPFYTPCSSLHQTLSCFVVNGNL